MATILKVTGLKKAFGHHQVLRGVDFTVETGHIVAWSAQMVLGKVPS